MQRFGNFLLNFGVVVAGFSALAWCFCLWILNDCFEPADIQEGLAWTGYWMSGIWHGLVLTALGAILDCAAEQTRNCPPPLH